MFKKSATLALGLIVPFAGSAFSPASAQKTFQVEQRWRVPGEGSRNYLRADPIGTIYTVSANFGPTPAATAAVPHPRPSPVPGSFTILVIGTK